LSRTVRDNLADRWLEMGFEKCQEACQAIGDQIEALYEEIDALNEGSSNLLRWESPTDEVALVTREELALVAHLGWGPKELIRHKRKLAR
jgi:hypothetical protein